MDSTRICREARVTQILLFLALIAGVFFAVNPADYIYANESSAYLSSSAVAYNGANYTLVYMSGKEILLLKSNSIVKDANEIESVVKYKCFASSYPTVSDLDSIDSNVMAWNVSRNAKTRLGPSESTCMNSIGQDKAECYDRKSCQIACGYNGMCAQYAMGAGLPFIDSLLHYAIVRKGFNDNIATIQSAITQLKSVSDASQVNFDVSAQMKSLETAIGNLNTLSTNMTTVKLLKDGMSGGYGFCMAPTYNTAALLAAKATAGSWVVKVGCFEKISSASSDILSETLARLDYYAGTKQKGAIQGRYNSLSEQFNALQAKSLNITAIFSDANLSTYVDDITALAVKFNQDMSAKLYDQASLDVVNYDAKLSEFRGQINALSAYADSLLGARSNASAALTKAGVLIEQTDGGAYGDLQALKNSLDALEQSLSAKITLADVEGTAAKFNQLASDTTALLDRKAEFDKSRAQSVFAGAARGISLAVLNAISSPLGIKEDEKRTWMASIPLMVLIIADVLIVAIVLILFFFLVWGKKDKFLKQKVLRTWAVIIVAIVLILAGLTWAVNSLIARDVSQTSLFAYLAAMEGKDSVIIFKERDSMTDPAALNACADKLSTSLTALGKNITVTEIVDRVCDSMVLSECLKQVGDKPLIRISYSNTTNSTSFYTFYRTEAEVKGDAAYINECTLSALMTK